MKFKQTIFVGKIFSRVNMKINFKKGFSIAEIVVVVGIMAILTTLVYTSLDSSKKQSRDQKRVAEISSVQLALEQFYARNKFYPSDLEDFVLKTYLSSVPDGVKYAPLNSLDNPLNTKCGSYHLYVTLESKISVLDSKKGFNSTSADKCINIAPTIDAGLTGNELVYDVTP
jgi:prepilin-type N-terminal cleavage/methylation domain-containing protein